MTRRTVKLVSSPFTLTRVRGGFVYEDKAAGYRRKLTDLEWAKLGALWHSLEYDRLLCKGKIPRRD